MRPAARTPGRLVLRHERALAPRMVSHPILVDHDGVRRVAQQADRLGMLWRTEEDDRVAPTDEFELALLGQHPRASAVDDLQPTPSALAMTAGVTP